MQTKMSRTVKISYLFFVTSLEIDIQTASINFKLLILNHVQKEKDII